MSYKIGYAGLGAMGTHMCNALGDYATAHSLPPLSVYNRSPAKYDGIKASCPGAFLAKEPKEIVEKSDVVFTCLVNDQAALEVYPRLLEGVKGKVIFVDQSSLHPDTAAEISAKVKEAGGVYLSCPVFGQPPAAKAKQLVCVMSGPKAEKEHIKPLLESMSKAVVDVGDDIKYGAQVKFLGNAYLLANIQVLSEIYTLAESIDFPADTFHNLFQTVFATPPLVNYSNKISKGLYDGSQGFMIDTGLKDARHVLSFREGLKHEVPLPTIEKAKENLEKAREINKNMDWSSLSVITRTDAGLEPFKEGSDQRK